MERNTILQRVRDPMLALFILALLVRLYQLSAQSLWLDEGSTWQTIQQGWGWLLAELFNPVSAYPLYHILLKAWVNVAGDSVWALRFPSALAGAAAVPVIYAIALEMQKNWDKPPDEPATSSPPPDMWERIYPTAAATLLLVSPFALWYAQEAKVYSLFLLVSALVFWTTLRAMHRGTRRAWLLAAAVMLAGLLVHRLTVLLMIAAWAGFLLKPVGGGARASDGANPVHRQRMLHWSLLAVACVGVIVAMVLGLGEQGASTGAHIPAGPGQALWLTFFHFSLNRGPGEFPGWWMVPWGALSIWGLVTLVQNSRGSGRMALNARLLLCFLLVPLALFLVQLSFTRLYETRYLMGIFPVWLLTVTYPMSRHLLLTRKHTITLTKPDHVLKVVVRIPLGVVLTVWLLFALALITCGAALVQPEKGLFSGDPVKEQYREAFEVLAERVHPDDVVVLHPAYLAPLYAYYMQHLSSDPPPEPALFVAFKQGQTEFRRKDWDAARQEYFAGHGRSFLLIAPDHARTVDIPNATYQDEYGLVGIYFQYSREEKKWPCGIWRFNGVHVFCQESPEAYETGEVFAPSTRTRARFGEHLRFLGYTLKQTTPQGVGVYRAGGTIPLSLFWEVTQPIDERYHVFLHLCQECDTPPIASDDGPPLEGYLPTDTWLPRKPARDDRAIMLPPDLAPGEYTLLLGLYHPEAPAPEARVPVQGEPVLANNRLVLQTVEIVAEQG